MTRELVLSLVVGYIAILISVVFHEFAHAWVADRLGDDTARRQGLLTLNPMAQIRRHPVGVLLAPLIGAYNGFLVGWGSVPVDPSRVDSKHSVRHAQFLIAVAGPLANVLLVAVSLGLYAIAIRSGSFGGPGAAGNPFIDITNMLVRVNVLLAVFNMLPIAPLDGFTVVSSKAPDSWRPGLDFIENNGMMLLIVVIVFGGAVFGPVLRFSYFLLAAVR
ncbi:MAG: Zn-dependent protease [Bradymonadia bacterium]|jgi:Zn-dependent protease